MLISIIDGDVYVLTLERIGSPKGDCPSVPAFVRMRHLGT